MEAASLVIPETVSDYLQRRKKIEAWADQERIKLERVILHKHKSLYDECLPSIKNETQQLAYEQKIAVAELISNLVRW